MNERQTDFELLRGFVRYARGILAITPEEGAGVQALAERLTAEFDSWAVSQVQRAEPEGNVLAKYSLSLDAEFSRSLSNSFSAGIIAALGAERGEMLLGYARSWTADLGMSGGTSAMTLERPGTEEERIRLELKMPGGGTMSTDVSPHLDVAINASAGVADRVCDRPSCPFLDHFFGRFHAATERRFDHDRLDGRDY